MQLCVSYWIAISNRQVKRRELRFCMILQFLCISILYQTLVAQLIYLFLTYRSEQVDSKTFLVFFFHKPVVFTLDPAVIKVSASSE